MKIAFPTQENNGLDSSVFGHFGSASRFVIVDTDTNHIFTSDNPDQHHLHGRCQPLKALGEQPVDAVVVGGIGGGALRKLMAAGIRIYRAVEGSILDNLELIQQNRLPAFTMNDTCGGQGHEGCIH